MSNNAGIPGVPPNFPAPLVPGQEPGTGNRKTLFIILGAVAAAVVLGLVATFVWVIPALSRGGDNQAQPAVTSQQTATEQASDDVTEQASEQATDAATDELPPGAIALPAGWDALAGPSNIPADGDPAFAKFVTGESSFQYLKEWSYDGTFGLTTDPETGLEMQQVAQGTEGKDADGISMAFAFFAESEEGKYGTDPQAVKDAIGATRAKLMATPTADLPQYLVGHKCASDFKTSPPETAEFRRGYAVVVAFTCKTAAGDDIKAVNLFSVTPWGTPQRMGISGHASYWDAHPGLIEKIGNSYRINKWKQ